MCLIMKATVVFPADAKPDIDPADPRIRIEMEGGLTVLAKVNAKAARKLREHVGVSVLQGRLVIDQGDASKLSLRARALPLAHSCDQTTLEALARDQGDT